MSEIAEMALMLAAEAMSKSESGGDTYTKDEIDGFLSDKVDKETGKSLSTNDFTDEFKDKLISITNPMILKGRVDTFEELANISSPQAGWVYFVGGEAAVEFEEYVFTESGTWEFIGFNNIDLSNYVQKDELQAALGNKANSADVYTKTESDSRFLGINGTAIKAVADGTGANIAESFANIKSNIAVNKTTLGTQCKNLLKNTAGTVTRNGVTFTMNSDKSITMSGTCTGTTGVFLSTIYLDVGSYILSTGIDNSMNFQLYEENETTYISTLTVTNQYTLNITESKKYAFKLIASNGKAYNNVTIYPMLRYADIQDGTYEAYAPSLQEQINALTARISALEGT